MPSESSANQRHHRFFEKTAARDKIAHERDLRQFELADQREKSGKLTPTFKKIKLKGVYKNLTDQNGRDLGGCVRRAFREALGIDVTNLPEGVDSYDMPAICEELGLSFYTGVKQLPIPAHEDSILFLQTKYSAHAVVTDNPAKIVAEGKKIVGVITIPSKSDPSLEKPVVDKSDYEAEVGYMASVQRHSEAFDHFVQSVPEDELEIKAALKNLYHVEPGKLLDPEKLEKLKKENRKLFDEINKYYGDFLKKMALLK